MHIKQNRMQIFIFLYILGVNIFQATGNENSTQMHYVVLTIDRSAIDKITKILQPFLVSNTVVVNRIDYTTSCQNASGVISCSCSSGYIWSDKVCQSAQKCCGNNNCIFSNTLPHMCVSSNTVKITGSITLNPQDYKNCLEDQSLDIYKQCNSNLTTQMKKVYSTLMGFDILTILKYRLGSIIADFQVIIVSPLSSQDLINKSTNLTKTLQATLSLQTTGVVRIGMPANPVPYYSERQINCTSQDDLNTSLVWQLQNPSGAFVITNGTEAKVASVPMQTTVTLFTIRDLWAGQYTCNYTQYFESFTITHKASALMDVCLLPNIHITTSPTFPICGTNSDLKTVKASCEVAQSNESYIVNWSKQNMIGIIEDKYSTGQTVYTATTIVDCNSSAVPQVTCTFTNRCNQTANATIDINIIKVGDAYCPADTVNGWENTKAGQTAVIKCTSGAGQSLRTCMSGGSTPTWGMVVSNCVNQDLNNVLQKAIIVDIGLGSLDSNAATVFYQLQNATNKTGTIDSFANINAAVQVFSNLSHKLNQINDKSTVKNFLESSSNLLEKSLQNSWTINNLQQTTSNNNVTLAETYLSSVENLIYMTNLTSGTKNTNVEVATCYGTQCNNSVFNVNITLASSNNGRVKTAGFQQLQNYLPYDTQKQTPNSIIVSTTTDGTQDSVEITIDFPLLKPRPPNVWIQCVSWNNISSSWSTEGCQWKGPKNEGRCVCTHLTSFAILMSRTPEEPIGVTEITYVGLSVSIVSLTISLVIEFIVWSAVVKTNTLYLRHIAHINISLCLMVADCCFLASSQPSQISPLWCETFVVLKHFCFLSMFFWMLCLSSTLLHQAIFLFHNVSKKNYLRFSLVLGYACPFLIVFITFLTNQGGAESSYYSKDTCWLVYTGLFKGTIFTFLIPVGIIVFINVFSMLVVIMKLLDHPTSTEKSQEKEKTAAKTVMRTVILLTPIFGVTWILGFGVMLLDLTYGPVAYAINYAFTLLNSFQGFFILITTCLGDKMIREALRNRLKKKAPVSTSESTTKLESSWKK